MLATLIFQRPATADEKADETRRAEWAKMKKPLSPAEESKWIGAFKNQTTSDGSTVLQTLEHVQRLRPTAFKFGQFYVGYSGSTGLPGSVSVEYFLGDKRLPIDAYSATLDVTITDGKFKFSPNRANPGSAGSALIRGRNALQKMVDEDVADQN